MKICVFTGPTLSPEEARSELDAVYLPPAAQGDVYRASLDQPWAIAVIDGYFERVPSVWHKEILWAMAQGIHVYGSASMGALRAAELADLGMIGVGSIFEAFKSGELEDDDEVAVAHAPEAQGYRAASEAMVNIRSTIASATSAGVVGPETAGSLVRIAKGLFYPDRCYPILLARGLEQRLPAAEIDALRGWLRLGQINQKRLDALAMLRAIKEHLAGDRAPKQVLYHFEHTDAWEETRRSVGQRSPVATSSAEERATPVDAILDELRIAGDFVEGRRGAMARALAIEAATQQGRAVEGRILRDAVEAFRRDHRLFQSQEFQRWIEEHDIDDIERFFKDEAQVRWVDAVFEPSALRLLPDHLRATGQYGALVARAVDKQRVLAAHGLATADLADLEVTEEALFLWYFEEHLQRSIPPDLASYAEEAGFGDETSLRRAVLRELAYVSKTAQRAESPFEPDESQEH
jgi:hypothetical protein